MPRSKLFSIPLLLALVRHSQNSRNSLGRTSLKASIMLRSVSTVNSEMKLEHVVCALVVATIFRFKNKSRFFYEYERLFCFSHIIHSGERKSSLVSSTSMKSKTFKHISSTFLVSPFQTGRPSLI